MTQKVLKVGSSAAVTIPKKSLEALGLKIGDQITVEVNARKRTVVISPSHELSKEDLKVAKIAYNFINQYRKDLESLAKR